ncbi:MAG: DUF998 domain-containing protein [Acidimicrobiales bacterium]
MSSHLFSRQIGVARVLGVLGLLAYNWWVIVPFESGWMTSLDGFFSDMSADGQPHAWLMQRADMVAGVLLVAALLLRGPTGSDGTRRREWPWLVAFSSLGAIGGRFPYACAAGLDPACRRLERSLDLPWHHYVHMAAGVGEFATITLAIWLAYRRTRGSDSVEAQVFRFLIYLLVVAYPLLAVAYLGDVWGSLIEPVFFLAFTSVLLAELFEPVGSRAVDQADLASPG